MQTHRDAQAGVAAGDGVIGLSGRITSRITVDLMEAYLGMDKPRGEVRLDFSAADHLDVSGINALVKLYLRASSEGVRLFADGLNPEMIDAFRATRIDGTIVPGSVPADRPEPQGPRAWARPVERLRVGEVPAGAVSLNVDGLPVSGVMQGFGRLWEKTYRIRLSGIGEGPREVIDTLKARFPDLQPSYNRFYPLEGGISPGSLVLINAGTPVGPVYTGVQVLYADEESFAFITPQGHPESGWVRFSAHGQPGEVVVQVQGFARASDPLYEIGFVILGSRLQERIWRHLLVSLGKHYGREPYVSVQKSCPGDFLCWENAGNVLYNAQIRTMWHLLMKLAGR
ncbi:MAG: STAS domain-containing protein [Desulfomonilia bacterium]